MTSQEIINEVKKAAERGPVYVLVFAGAILLLGADPAEIVVPRSHILNTSEFVTVNIVAGALIVIAGIISLLATRSTMHTVQAISSGSSETTAKTLETVKELAQHAGQNDVVLQNKLADITLEANRQLMGTQQPPNGAAPAANAAAPADTSA
jgi:hypothetical protein